MTKHDFFSRYRDRLPLDRLLVVEERITSALADHVIGRILDLESASRADIYLFIASPGGDLKAALAIYEAMRFTNCHVATIAVGDAASSAALLLAAGSPGCRGALSRTRITLHPPRAECPGHEIDGMQMRRLSALVFRILSEHIGHPPAAIEAEARNELTFTARQARSYGLVDWVDDLPPARGRPLRSAASLRSV